MNLKSLFGSSNDRYIKKLRKIVEKINALESEFEKLSDTETRIRIYDGNGAFVERKIPTELTKGYVLCLQHSNYQYIDLDGCEK